MRVDIEETANPGVVVYTESVSTGSDTVNATGLTTLTNYTAFLRCSYDIGMGVVDDYVLDSDTFTTL